MEQPTTIRKADGIWVDAPMLTRALADIRSQIVDDAFSGDDAWDETQGGAQFNDLMVRIAAVIDAQAPFDVTVDDEGRAYTKAEVNELFEPFRKLGFNGLPSGWVSYWSHDQLPDVQTVAAYASGVASNVAALFADLHKLEAEVGEYRHDRQALKRIFGDHEYKPEGKS